MSDFVYSKIQTSPGKLSKAIKSIYTTGSPTVFEFHGDWGSLAVSVNQYNGFRPFETSGYICIIIGGPLLVKGDNNFINQTDSNEGTKAIFLEWKSGKIAWDLDLSGPFVALIINKRTNKINVITDIMSFIPVYIYQDDCNTVVGTHVDALAKVSKVSSEIDKISCADFVLHGTITFPYTLYKGIYQIEPASIYSISNNSKIDSMMYWKPYENYKYKSIKDAAKDIQIELKNYLSKVTERTSNIAQFISGGEDSRVLSALLYTHKRNAFVFLDQFNREGKMAKRTADIYNADFKLYTRDKEHYVNILQNCSDLVGSGAQYHHAHTYGFHEKCKLNEYDAVFGGLFSDALLKGARINKNRISNKLPLIGEFKNVKYNVLISENKLITNHTIEKLNTRRINHLNTIKNFRNESAEEWFELWPASMNKAIANLYTNRRLFKSYEPFLANEIVKISASIPQKWKLNRRLFYYSSKEMLKPAKWIPHSDGRLPYFPWYINTFLQFGYKIYRRLGYKIGLIKGNQGPWGQWSKNIESEEWKSLFSNYEETVSKFSSIFNEKDKKYIIDIFKKGNLPIFIRVNFLQLLYQTHKHND